MNHGLIIEPPTETDYIFGGGKLGDLPLNPSGDWSDYLPPNEIQNLNGIEPYACVSFATLNCVEILERKLYGATRNWADRFLATMSGTKERQGNSPQQVSETLKSKGCPQERHWTFDETINTYEKFYADIPENIKTLALEFKAEYSFGHEYVPSNAQALMEALKYSPVALSVYAWVKDENGLYYRPQGTSDTHLTVCYGYEEGKCWKIYDSYLDNGGCRKKLRWDALPQQAKRFTLNRQIAKTPEAETAWTRFVRLLREILGIDLLGGRSSKWSTVRREFLASNPTCAVCGKKGTLLSPNEVHHLQSFATHPELELEISNLRTVCREHHQWFCHLGNWASINEEAEIDLKVWEGKVKNRPKWDGKEWIYQVGHVSSTNHG